MKPNRYTVLLPLVPLLATSWLVLGVVVFQGPREHFVIGAVLGTMLGQTTLASSWTAIGPGLLLWRLPLSLAWIATLVIAFALNPSVGGPRGEVVVLIGGCLLGQWLLVQIPLWWLALAHGLRLWHRSDVAAGPTRPPQFGIRQLMILTAIVAILLGVGRVIAPALLSGTQGSREWSIFLFLATAGILMGLPLLLATVIPRYAIWAVPIVLCLIGAATWWEMPLLNQLAGTRPGPVFWDFVWINFFQSAWIVFVMLLLRGFGYGAAPSGGESPFATSGRVVL
jgi:hypothetical protein